MSPKENPVASIEDSPAEDFPLYDESNSLPSEYHLAQTNSGVYAEELKTLLWGAADDFTFELRVAAEFAVDEYQWAIEAAVAEGKSTEEIETLPARRVIDAIAAQNGINDADTLEFLKEDMGKFISEAIDYAEMKQKYRKQFYNAFPHRDEKE